MSQMDLFGKPAQTVSPVPSQDDIRARLETILSLLRAASEMPWTEREAARWKLVVPQMADWLPPEERERLCAEFADLVSGLETKAA